MNKNPGCEKAPKAIINELENFFLNESGEDISFQSDEVFVVQNNFEETNDAIYKKVLELKENAILLGGDHSITFSAVKAFAKNHKDVGIIMFDAHPDCESDFMPPTHEDFIRGIINQNIVPAENILLVGIRHWHADEEDFLQKNKVNLITGKDIGNKPFSEIIDEVLAFANKFTSIYLSLDIDVVDPAFAPATGYPEPAGISSREFITAIQHLKILPQVKMIDLVEINPALDKDNMTVRLGAKIVKELL
jgi:arginase family enzyme